MLRYHGDEQIIKTKKELPAYAIKDSYKTIQTGTDIVCSKKPTRTHWLGTTRGKAPFSTGGAQRGPLECIIRIVDHSFELHRITE